MTTKLASALRKKYSSPKDAIRALGLDESLIDSNQEIAMATEAQKMKALATRMATIGALVAYSKPRLAMDARIDMGKVFDGVTGSKFKEMKPVIANRIKEQAKGHMAKDASLDDVEKVLDMLDGHEVDGGDESVSKEQHNAMEAAAHGTSNLDIPKAVGEEFVDKDKGKAFDAEGFKNFLKEKGMGEDDINSAMGMLPKPTGMDEDDEEAKKEAAEKAKKEQEAKDAAMKDMVTKPAMDAAIKTAVDAATKQVRSNERGIRLALDEVRPFVGEIAPEKQMAFDSGHDVIRHALVMKGVEGAKDLHNDALRAVLNTLPKAGARPVETAKLGMDSSQAKGFAERFPDAARIRAA